MAAVLPTSLSSAPREPGPAEVAAWARELEGESPETIIQFAARRFDDRLAVATQFGVEGCTLLHRVSRHAPSAYVFSIDTGLLFAETHTLAQRLERQLGIEIHRVLPEQSVAMQAVKLGPNLWERDPELCCTLRKVIPMQRTLEGFGAWMTSIRRGQTASRAETPVVQWDERFGLVKFAPLAAQSDAAVDAYIKEHAIPTNPLRLVGYRSIGCAPCTRPVADNEDTRAGRWWRSDKTECGLHQAPPNRGDGSR